MDIVIRRFVNCFVDGLVISRFWQMVRVDVGMKTLVLSEAARIADFCVYSFEPWRLERVDGVQAVLSSSFARGDTFRP